MVRCGIGSQAAQELEVILMKKGGLLGDRVSEPLAQPRHAAPQDGERGAQPVYARRPALTATASMKGAEQLRGDTHAGVERSRARLLACAARRSMPRSRGSLTPPIHAAMASRSQLASAAAVATAALAAARELLRCDQCDMSDEPTTGVT